MFEIPFAIASPSLAIAPTPRKAGNAAEDAGPVPAARSAAKAGTGRLAITAAPNVRMVSFMEWLCPRPNSCPRMPKLETVSSYREPLSEPFGKAAFGQYSEQ